MVYRTAGEHGESVEAGKPDVGDYDIRFQFLNELFAFKTVRGSPHQLEAE